LHPSAGITQFRFMRSARGAPSQPGSRAPAYQPILRFLRGNRRSLSAVGAARRGAPALFPCKDGINRRLVSPRHVLVRLETKSWPGDPGQPCNAGTSSLGGPPGGGEEVGQDPIDLGVQREAHMAAVDLDRIDVGSQARPPVDDPVSARVQRSGRYSWRRREVAQETFLDRRWMTVAKDVENVRRSDARHGQRVDVERRTQGRAKRDHLLDELWISMR